jgi:GT2 family glycosyltransferase
MRDFDVIVVDNSARGLVAAREGVRVISNDLNVGFGAAINQGIRASESPYIATLNDDAVAQPGWLEALTRAIAERPEIGMCASQVVLVEGEGLLDSAGMLVSLDGSSKQCGHREPPENFGRRKHALLPSGCAALYKREMLDEIGAFDESFFLYCEDTDLGLRARWAAWECVYVPDATVEHRYSHSAGAASALKAYYVERNRLYLLVKNFPARMLWAAPFHSLARYFWHAVYSRRGQGAAATYRRSRGDAPALPLLVWRAHIDLLRNLRRLWQERKKIRRRLTPQQFRKLLKQYSIGVRKVASL